MRLSQLYWTDGFNDAGSEQGKAATAFCSQCKTTLGRDWTYTAYQPLAISTTSASAGAAAAERVELARTYHTGLGV